MQPRPDFSTGARNAGSGKETIMTTPFNVAFQRAAVQSLVTGLLIFFTTWQTTDDVKVLATTTAIGVLTPLAMRFGVEGYLDTIRAEKRTGITADTFPDFDYVHKEQ